MACKQRLRLPKSSALQVQPYLPSVILSGKACMHASDGGCSCARKTVHALYAMAMRAIVCHSSLISVSDLK